MLFKLEQVLEQLIVPQTVRQSLGNRVLSVAFIPFIRARTITFTFGLRPNTRVFLSLMNNLLLRMSHQMVVHWVVI